MKLFLSSLLILILIISCDESVTDDERLVNSKIEEIDFQDYFFPADSLIPFVYVFQGTHNPLDEKFFRIYRLQDNQDTSLVIERYNSNFRITEGFTHNLRDSLKLSDYMIVDGEGVKRKANVLSDRTFPLAKNDISYFVADFPAPSDSLTMIYESRKSVADLNFKKYVLGDTVDALRIIDSVRVHVVNPKTKESNTKLVVTSRYYAKGYGLVEWGSDELNVHYRLMKILSNEWWSEFAQVPQVRM
jgi:hypothetical protein